MKSLVLSLALAGAIVIPASAGSADEPDQSLSSEKTHAATGGGSIATPTAPKSGTISDTATEGTDSGTNASTNPTDILISDLKKRTTKRTSVAGSRVGPAPLLLFFCTGHRKLSASLSLRYPSGALPVQCAATGHPIAALAPTVREKAEMSVLTRAKRPARGISERQFEPHHAFD